MKPQKLMAAGLIFAVSAFSSINCLAQEDADKGAGRELEKKKKTEKTLRDGVDVEKKARGGIANLIEAVCVWWKPAAEYSFGPNGEKAARSVTKGLGSGDMSINEAMEDKTPQAPPTNNYYDDPRLDPREREQLIELERKMKSDPDVAENCKNQIRRILDGSGIHSPYDAEQKNSPLPPQSAATLSGSGTMSLPPDRAMPRAIPISSFTINLANGTFHGTGSTTQKTTPSAPRTKSKGLDLRIDPWGSGTDTITATFGGHYAGDGRTGTLDGKAVVSVRGTIEIDAAGTLRGNLANGTVTATCTFKTGNSNLEVHVK